jgi:hypothetical protein
VVDHALLLLEGGLVLLVHDDRPRSGKGRNSARRAPTSTGRPLRHARQVSRRRGVDLGMPERRRARRSAPLNGSSHWARARSPAADERLPPLPQALRDGIQVHLRLAGSP